MIICIGESHSMPRLRFTYDDAKARAEQLAIAFAATQDWGDRTRLDGAGPEPLVRQGKSSKHPTVWSMRFVSHRPDAVVDGGDLFVVVDLETRIVNCKLTSN